MKRGTDELFDEGKGRGRGRRNGIGGGVRGFGISGRELRNLDVRGTPISSIRQSFC